MAENSPQFVKARYIGQHVVQLPPSVRRYYNIAGTRRTKLTLEQGDTLMMPAQEILGQSLLFDPKAQRPPLYLGTGKRVLPEHAGLDDDALSLLGYEHHQGRPDFELVADDAARASNAAPAAADTPLAPPTISSSTESDAAQPMRAMGG